MHVVIGVLAGAVAGFVVSYLLRMRIFADTKAEADQIIKEAKRKAQELIKSAEIQNKEHLLHLQSKLEKEFSSKKKKLEQLSEKLSERETMLEKRSHHLAERESALMRSEKYFSEREEILRAKMRRYDQLIEEEIARLEKFTMIPREEAKRELFETIKKQKEKEILEMINKIEERAREEAEEKAREIICQAIQKIGVGHWAETAISVVNLPSNSLKGRIIGREGRNIRTFETLLGVEVLVDDTPGAITISAFDPVRREKAKLAMERLILDGRIHPARIEEVVKEVEKDMEKIIIQSGKETVQELGIIDLNPALYPYIGKMKYRTSYGQNLLQHSIEVARLATRMAEELGLDTSTAKEGGLLHDIGKVVDEYEGSHAQIGARIVQEFGAPKEVVNAIEAHHDEVRGETPLAFIIASADAISCSRPGARRESLDSYLQRLEKLEKIALSYKGVEKAYAIQAGRELRVLIQPDLISDIQTEELAHQISQHIERELKYPGYIKVVVIREVRKIDYAR